MSMHRRTVEDAYGSPPATFDQYPHQHQHQMHHNRQQQHGLNPNYDRNQRDYDRYDPSHQYDNQSNNYDPRHDASYANTYDNNYDGNYDNNYDGNYDGNSSPRDSNMNRPAMRNNQHRGFHDESSPSSHSNKGQVSQNYRTQSRQSRPSHVDDGDDRHVGMMMKKPSNAQTARGPNRPRTNSANAMNTSNHSNTRSRDNRDGMNTSNHSNTRGRDNRHRGILVDPDRPRRRIRDRNASLRFSNVELIFFPTTVGDTPVMLGPPITMAWIPSDLCVLSMDEMDRIQRNPSAAAAPETDFDADDLAYGRGTIPDFDDYYSEMHMQMRIDGRRDTADNEVECMPLSAKQRQRILRSNGVTWEAIREATMQSHVVLQQRLETRLLDHLDNVSQFKTLFSPTVLQRPKLSREALLRRRQAREKEEAMQQMSPNEPIITARRNSEYDEKKIDDRSQDDFSSRPSKQQPLSQSELLYQKIQQQKREHEMLKNQQQQLYDQQQMQYEQQQAQLYDQEYEQQQQLQYEQGYAQEYPQTQTHYDQGYNQEYPNQQAYAQDYQQQQEQEELYQYELQQKQQQQEQEELYQYELQQKQQQQEQEELYQYELQQQQQQAARMMKPILSPVAASMGSNDDGSSSHGRGRSSGQPQERSRGRSRSRPRNARPKTMNNAANNQDLLTSSSHHRKEFADEEPTRPQKRNQSRGRGRSRSRAGKRLEVGVNARHKSPGRTRPDATHVSGGGRSRSRARRRTLVSSSAKATLNKRMDDRSNGSDEWTFGGDEVGDVYEVDMPQPQQQQPPPQRDDDTVGIARRMRTQKRMSKPRRDRSAEPRYRPRSAAKS